jgi:probable HAF family extracellular repeat protein
LFDVRTVIPQLIAHKKLGKIVKKLPVTISSLPHLAVAATLAVTLGAWCGDNAPGSAAPLTSTATTPLLGSTVRSTEEPVYRVTDLGALGGLDSTAASVALGINNAGQVVGSASTRGGRGEHASMWDGVKVTSLAALGGRGGQAYGINNAGQVVGLSFVPGLGQYHATLWNRGTATDLGTLGGGNSVALAVNNSGQITGFGYLAGTAGYHGALWGKKNIDLGTLGGSYSRANAINNAGHAVGVSSLAGNTISHAALWKGGAAIDLGSLSHGNSCAQGINNAGLIVGWSITGNGHTHATFWKENILTDIGTVTGATDSVANAINNSGLIVGNSGNGGNIQRATIWVSNAAIDLNTLVDSSGKGVTLNFATGVNDAGQIVGIMSSAKFQRHAFLLTPLDEHGKNDHAKDSRRQNGDGNKHQGNDG